MDPNIETLFKEVPAFEESELYRCPEYEQANSIASKVSDILTEFCGQEVAQLMREYILAELQAEEVVNLYYFRQGYLAAKSRCHRPQAVSGIQ